ncbi:MAG: hypothetical protein M0006_15875 [Magnetospirillum sp.]|nr:hypothetical protein [Magnetospirillum sp.]
MDATYTPTITEQDLVDLGRQHHLHPLQLRKARLFFFMETRAAFYDDLAEEFRQGYRLNEALHTIWDIETQGGTIRMNSSLGVIIPAILYRMHDLGEEFDVAFSYFASPLETLVLSTAPTSGLTPALLANLAIVIRKLSTWSFSLIWTAMPIIALLSAIIGIFYGTGAFYFPLLLKRAPNIHLTGQAHILYVISLFFLHWGWLVFLGVAAGTVIIFWQAPNATGPARRILDHVWPASLYRRWAGLGFVVSLAALISANRQEKEALAVLAKNSTPYLRERIDAILVTDDKRLADAMTASPFKWPDDTTIRKIRSAMRRTAPGVALETLANNMLARMTTQMNITGALISWGGTLIVGLIIAWLSLAVNDITAAIETAAHQHVITHH